ncbi:MULTISPECIES: hypothetical protein [Salimicrobium]|uniref:Uncharacterized protein n=3 Tax=Salimicrobium TaxID=351195 RepID=K2GCR9_9BACI|nr:MULTISPECIES: hypothetical protein [Salimicrobium]AKG03566.1 hypothetical protein AAV35_001375 [Salimicrobium jeotgali]EKE32057.1 hypothetical protein MJ3_05538 [Salimicrobium jeotgali]MBM7696024.1 hypothetical protein [Salimicrobium jeotgali]SDX85666.1 hypothetical protein SAMN04488081_1503 [Salimicrobium album]SIS87585.1 hypothetical protein SAMN05421758_10819 [Salimicrobium salexigens]
MAQDNNLETGLTGLGFALGAVGGFFLYRDTRFQKQQSHRRLKKERKSIERYSKGSDVHHSIEADKLQLRQEAARAARYENNLTQKEG